MPVNKGESGIAFLRPVPNAKSVQAAELVGIKIKNREIQEKL
jgi:hypothetical protein